MNFNLYFQNRIDDYSNYLDGIRLRWHLSGVGVVRGGNCPRWELSGWKQSIVVGIVIQPSETKFTQLFNALHLLVNQKSCKIADLLKLEGPRIM